MARFGFIRTLAVQMIAKYFALSVLALLASASVHGEVPNSLQGILAENNCRDLSGDARVSRFDDQWWVSLEPFTGSETDYAFYCQDAEEEDSARLMLAIRGERNAWRGCEPVVNSWQGSLPFRYSVKILGMPPVADLSQWWLVSSSHNETVTHGAEGQQMAGPIIDTTIRAGTVYGCYSGNWYRIGLD